MASHLDERNQLGYQMDEVEVIYQTRDTVFHHISNTEKRVENTTRSGVFLTNFEVFDIVMKRCEECLI